MTTETALLNWRNGPIQAERLCADILQLEGFKSIDPQCPLGGPDGRKDILCEKNNWTYVAAVYFPSTQKEFSDIEEKFSHDLEGVEKSQTDGIVFFVNQKITPSERKKLTEKAGDKKVLIYHIESLRNILDTPKGYGLRLEYLRIEMTLEDQTSFVQEWRNNLSSNIENMAFSIEEVKTDMKTILHRTTSLEIDLKSSEASPTEGLDFDFLKLPPTSYINTKLLCFLHLAHASGQHAGKIRNAQVWIGPRENPVFVPPKPSEVLEKLESLFSNWRGHYESCQSLNQSQKLKKIALFHHNFLSIHPFLDGNGRIAKTLMKQQANELLGSDINLVIREKTTYYEALRAADKGNPVPLIRLLTQIAFGSEFIAN